MLRIYSVGSRKKKKPLHKPAPKWLKHGEWEVGATSDTHKHHEKMEERIQLAVDTFFEATDKVQNEAVLEVMEYVQEELSVSEFMWPKLGMTIILTGEKNLTDQQDMAVIPSLAAIVLAKLDPRVTNNLDNPRYCIRQAMLFLQQEAKILETALKEIGGKDRDTSAG
jgi:hypothetical protein